MVVPPGLKATLAAATAVELFAGTSLTLTPRRFIQRTYGTRGAVDPLTLKFARCVRRRRRATLSSEHCQQWSWRGGHAPPVCALEGTKTSLTRAAASCNVRRTAGIAVGCLGVLSGACLLQDNVPDPALLTLTLYNVAATANNAALQGPSVPTLVHAGLSIALLTFVVARTRK
jgi:hypothetical protein